MCMMLVAGHAAETQNPGYRTGMFPQNGLNNSRGVPYTWGAGFSDAYTPNENLNSSAAGTAEKNRRKSLTPDQYGRGIWGKKASASKKASTPTKESAPPPVLRDNISTGSSNLRITQRRDRAEKRKVASGRSVSKVKTFKGK
jgi:hypothetical protein